MTQTGFADPKPNQHSRLTLPEAIAQYHDGLLTVAGLLYHAVRIYRKEGQRLRITSVSEFCKKLEISRRAFYKAKAKLINSTYLEEETFDTIDLVITNRSQVRTTGNTYYQPCTDREQSCTDREQLVTVTPPQAPRELESSPSSDIYQISNNSLSDSEREEILDVENSVPQTKGKASSDCPAKQETLSTSSDTNKNPDDEQNSAAPLNKTLQNLSDEEKEKFLAFAREKAAQLPKPPVLVEKWIVKNALELLEQFHDSAKVSQKAKIIAPESYQNLQNKIEQRRLALLEKWEKK